MTDADELARRFLAVWEDYLATLLSSAAATLFDPTASISAARPRSRSTASLDGSNASFKMGKTVRELDQSIIALAKCAANGRGTSRRSRRP